MIFMSDDGYFLTFSSMLYKNVSVIFFFFSGKRDYWDKVIDVNRSIISIQIQIQKL